MKWIASLGLCAGLLAGCADNSTPVECVPVAAPNNRDQRIEYDRPKPLPDNAYLWDRDREYQQANPPANNEAPKMPSQQTPPTNEKH